MLQHLCQCVEYIVEIVEQINRFLLHHNHSIVLKFESFSSFLKLV